MADKPSSKRAAPRDEAENTAAPAPAAARVRIRSIRRGLEGAKGISGSCDKIEEPFAGQCRSQFHVHQERPEFVCPLERVVENRIIEIEVELQKTVRNSHADSRLVKVYDGSPVLP